jgi:hypothetical protein
VTAFDVAAQIAALTATIRDDQPGDRSEATTPPEQIWPARDLDAKADRESGRDERWMGGAA